ncbi:anti-sigma factor, partial [Luteitalea sp.]|uniref:anti-sigma factor family protein n=1 Tax=Luteitalea sp. TaxID=2004800 RepID=UPI0025BF4247
AARPASHPAARRRSAVTPASAPPCAQADQLWAYLDGELPAARARAIARHLASCERCAAQARRLRAMLETCRAAGCRALPADVRARARERVKALMAAARKDV